MLGQNPVVFCQFDHRVQSLEGEMGKLLLPAHIFLESNQISSTDLPEEVLAAARQSSRSRAEELK